MNECQAIEVFAERPFDDPELLSVILNQKVTDVKPRRLRGVEGAMISTNTEGAERLAFHGAVYGWAMTEVETADGALSVLSGSTLDCGGRWPAIRREAAKEIMDAFGTEPPEALAARLSPVLSRADARVMASASGRVSESGLDRGDVSIISHDRPYSDFFTVEEFHLTHTRFDGSQSDVLKRAVFVAADAVTVLPYDPRRDRVLLVEQIRAGPLARGDRSPWILEPVAGRIEPGDTPEQTAHKESAEEAGLTLDSLHPVGGYYCSTGAFSEYVHSFIALADLPDGAAGLGGIAGEGEDIKGHLMDRATFMDRMRRGDMPDAPLLISAYWLAANLAQLRECLTGSVESG